MNYEDFIRAKEFQHIESGFDASDMWLPEDIFPHQRDSVLWACKRGRSAMFLDTGLGKTICQLSWAHNVQEHTDKPVLLLAPLCVAHQTIREGEKFGISCDYMREPKFANSRIHVTNYEMLKNFNPENYAGIVIDESSILKGMDGKTRKLITEFASTIPYRLSCTATPSPNDFMELGTQAEFLGVMSQVEMLAMFFIHDGSDTSKWRLKGHGKKRFWEWVSTWAIVMSHPSDLGYDEDGYDLPPLIYNEHIVETDPTDDLFVTVAMGLQDRNKARKGSVDQRVQKASDIANSMDGPVIVWCNLNEESDKLTKSIIDAVEVKGSDKSEHKENSLMGFTDGTVRILVSKPSIAGFGMNWQHCNQMIFVGLSDSWEKYYQAIRRCWRFGQTKPVSVHIVSADTEGAVLCNIKRKDQQNEEMKKAMGETMRAWTLSEIRGLTVEKTEYTPTKTINMPSFL